MRILVDADSMRPRLRSIVARAASRRNLRAIFVANRGLPLPGESNVEEMVVVDDADEWIAANVSGGDVAVTRDIPLAKRVIERGAVVITDRGECLTAENIGTRLSERGFAQRMRDSGLLETRGTSYGETDRRRDQAAFANTLDRELTARGRADKG